MKKSWILLIFMGVSNNVMSAADNPVKKLEPCPSSPNCVSTLANDKQHKIEPIRYSTALAEAKQKLISVLTSLPRIDIQKDENSYLHVTQTSLIFRFVDDVEFLFDDEQKLIQFRSASRTGYSDFGVNRERMEQIRTIMNQ